MFCLSVYLSYLFFQLFSHKALYQDGSEEILESKRYSENPFKIKTYRHGKRTAAPQYTETQLVSSPLASPQSHPRFSETANEAALAASDPESGHAVGPMLLEEESEEPQMSVSVSLSLLVLVTVVSLLVIFSLAGKGDR